MACASQNQNSNCSNPCGSSYVSCNRGSGYLLLLVLYILLAIIVGSFIC